MKLRTVALILVMLLAVATSAQGQFGPATPSLVLTGNTKQSGPMT